MTPRLAPCPCGSGRQYRRCCRANDRATEDARAKAAALAAEKAAYERAILARPCTDCAERRKMHRLQIGPHARRWAAILARAEEPPGRPVRMSRAMRTYAALAALGFARGSGR